MACQWTRHGFHPVGHQIECRVAAAMCGRATLRLACQRPVAGRLWLLLGPRCIHLTASPGPQQAMTEAPCSPPDMALMVNHKWMHTPCDHTGRLCAKDTS